MSSSSSSSMVKGGKEMDLKEGFFCQLVWTCDDAVRNELSSLAYQSICKQTQHQASNDAAVIGKMFKPVQTSNDAFVHWFVIISALLYVPEFFELIEKRGIYANSTYQNWLHRCAIYAGDSMRAFMRFEDFEGDSAQSISSLRFINLQDVIVDILLFWQQQ